MNLVDSSAWLAFFADEPSADYFSEPLVKPDLLIVPSVVIYEVFKVILRESGENDALQAYGAMSRGKIIDLGARLALSAAKLSLQYKLPMADSMILATARAEKATLWTQDVDFKEIPGVRYLPKGAST